MGPAEAVHQSANMVAMVLYAEAELNHFGDARCSPHFRAESVRPGAIQQKAVEFPKLGRMEF